MATAGNDDSQIILPGFNLYGKDYDSLSNGHFASALQHYTMPLTTLREFTMMRLMNQLTDKLDWNIKVFNENIANKWKNEALAVEGIDISQGMVDWCIEELRYKAKTFEKTGMVTVYNGDVIKSDMAVSPSLRLALENAVMHLENVPPLERDWHPGSDEKVLDLVHPSLFPLVSGLSRILPNGTTTLENFIERSGDGITLPFYNQKRGTWVSMDENFQWLPCEVDLSSNEPKITSYINNLHPHQHKGLYCIIEQIIGCAIPLWNESLTRQKTPEYKFQRVEYRFAEPEDDEEPWANPKRESNQDENEYFEVFDRWSYTEAGFEREALQPKVKPFKPPNQDLFEEDGITLKSEHKVDLKRDHNRIQVIVKLANIHLTPEQPKYEGGTWHVEGQLNEHICASALLYYSSNNITPSHLGFCHMVLGGRYYYGDIHYMQGYHRWLEDVFGCRNRGPAIQDIGNVLTKEGRLITFPNTLQHQVQPFELADPTKPGHRKILALFLVDPGVNIISTANVPCQRMDWWRAAIEEQESLLGKLPPELRDNVYEMVEDFPITTEKAEEVRLELMDVRKDFVIQQDGYFDNTTFSLCEH